MLAFPGGIIQRPAQCCEWLKQHGFIIEHLFGDRRGNPYSEASGRAIFWARI